MRLLLLLAVVAVLAGGAALLYWVPPAPGSIYPPCLFRSLTGLYCPGCGSTRCLHALLHGDLRQAAAYNVLLLVALPLLVCCGARWLWQVGKPRTPPRRRLPAWAIRVLFVVVVAYWALRNMDCAPFNWLAPHTLP
ncbi:MAG: DUF2752 domain-containing protein [Gemmataceae bacterium]|nr:DUF2752 domain-containing protein [Gemmataceae bacterium]